MRSRFRVLLWVLTALSVLQWTAPSVDPWLFARLSAGATQEAGLAVAERQSPAVEARAATSSVVFEKRPTGGRSLASAEDPPPALTGRPAPAVSGAAAAATAAGERPPPFLDGHGATARGPPGTA